MATREMTTAEHAQTARDFLAASDREFAPATMWKGNARWFTSSSPVCWSSRMTYHNRRKMTACAQPFCGVRASESRYAPAPDVVRLCC